MVHFICTGGCGGVAKTPGMCKAEDCPFYAEELQECHCEDGLHEISMRGDNGESGERGVSEELRDENDEKEEEI